MIAALSAGLYVLGFVAALHAVLRVRTAQGAVAWALSLLVLPAVALPAYLVFGRSRLAARVRAFQERKPEIDAHLEDYRRALAPFVGAASEDSTPYGGITRLTGFEFTHDNDVHLLVDGEQTYDDLIAHITDARAYVLVQYYTLRDDDIGERLGRVLAERARDGLHVQVLYDAVGSVDLSSRFVESLREAGVAINEFRADRSWRNRIQLNFRNHRKMVVVDGVFGWLGGLNVGDEHLDGNPDLSPWRDTHIRIEGPAVQQLQAVLVTDWFWATGTVPDVDWSPEPARSAARDVLLVPSGPTQRLETASLLLVVAIASARSRLWLSTPYFVPDDAVLKALQSAALRGIDVRVLLPGQSDSSIAHYAGWHHIQELRGLGIRFLAWPGFVHQKAVLVDERVALVGSSNIDNRSFRLNFEITAVIADRSTAGEVARMFEADFRTAEELCVDDPQERSLRWRLAVGLARLAAPLL